MTSLILQQAAKRFQQRAALPSSLASIRTQWGRSDIEALAPLLGNYHQQIVENDSNTNNENQELALEEIKSCESVFIIWKLFVNIFSLFEIHQQQPQRVAQRFLQIHSETFFDFESVAGGAAEFGRVASRGIPNLREFNFAYRAALSFALSGRVNEASLVLESMIQGVNGVIEDRNLRSENNNNNDEDDAPDGPFSPEEQSVFEAVAQLLRVPFTESREALNNWRSAASKLLADVRSVAVVVPGRVPELDILRRLTLQILFTISGDNKVLKETINTCDFLDGKALWYAAGVCSLMSPLATKKQIVDAITEYGAIPQSSTSFSPVRVTGGNAAKANNDEAPTDFDMIFINALACDRVSNLVTVIPHAVNVAINRNASRTNSAKATTLAALMGAHVADLCCDLREPDEFMERNKIVEDYVKTLFVHFPGLWEIAFSYITSSPLMDPQAVVLCLRQGVGLNSPSSSCSEQQHSNLELCLRLYDEVLHPRCAHQEQLRLRWRRSNPNIDWGAIFETVDIVLEEERRKIALDRATLLWEQEGRFVDAVNLLVSTGNYTAAEFRIRQALENFASSSSSTSSTNEDGAVLEAADVEENLSCDAVICIGDAASLGQVADPTLEGKLQRKAAHNLILASNTSGASSLIFSSFTSNSIGVPTPLALCRRIAELYNARNSINILDFIFPIIADQNFVVSTPSAVKRFVLTLAVANMNQASMEQLLVLNNVMQQCPKEFGGEEGLTEQSKKVLDLLIR